jgi:hypothetical protein
MAGQGLCHAAPVRCLGVWGAPSLAVLDSRVHQAFGRLQAAACLQRLAAADAGAAALPAGAVQ